MNNQPEETAFLPGSFDPPHRGHLAEVITGLDNNVANKIALVVVRPANKGAPLLSAENSAGLLQIMIRDAVKEGLAPEKAARIGPIIIATPGKNGEANIETAARQLGATAMLQGLDYGIEARTYAANIKASMANAGVPEMQVIFMPRDGRASSDIRKDLHEGRFNPEDVTPGVGAVLAHALKAGAPQRIEGPESPFRDEDRALFNRSVTETIAQNVPRSRAIPAPLPSPTA